MDKNPDDEEVQVLVQKWRDHISNNYYLMYVADERFTKNIDKYKEGLAKFLSDAMNVYCDNKK